MKNVLWASVLFLFYLVTAHAEEPLCEERSFTDLEGILQVLQEDHSPKMVFGFEIQPDCSYRSHSEVLIFDDGPLESLLARKIMNPDYLIPASNGDIKKINFEDSPSFMQVTEVSQFGMNAKVRAICTQVNTGVETRSVCDVQEEVSKVKIGLGPFSSSKHLFERHMATTVCREVGPELKKCIFTTEGKARSVPTKDACEMAYTGAQRGFNSTYRLAHLINTGVLDKTRLSAGESFIENQLNGLKQQPRPASLENLQVP